MWIDTQGHEAKVLAGAEKTLARRPPMLIEFWPPVLGDAASAVLDLLTNYGSCRDMRTGRLVERREELLQTYANDATDLLMT